MSTKKPNVVFMLVDDLGIGDVSCFNPKGKIHTQHIDELAANGMKFDNSHASSSLCSPSRYSLLTGRYNWRSRLKAYVLPGDSETLIEHDRKTLAHLFKEQGYHTAAVGKWHLGMDWVYKGYNDYAAYGITAEDYPDNEKSSTPCGRDGNFDMRFATNLVEGIDIDYSQDIQFGPNQYGFDYFFGTAASLDQPPFVYIENNHVLQEPTKITGSPHLDRVGASQQQKWQLGVIADNYKHQDCPNVMQAKVLELIDNYSEQKEPFFLYYPCHLVHGPILPDEQSRGKSAIGPYGDFVLQTDRYVGEITAKLKEKGIWEDTIFIFTSDNGASGIANFEELAKLGHCPSSIYRGHKMDIWEGGHREPTIVSYPGTIASGTTAHQLVCHTDFFATFAQMLGASVDEKTAEDSFSLLPIWQGSTKEQRINIVHSSANGGFSIRTNEWKLNLVKDGGNTLDNASYGPYELFNIKEDVREQHNVIDAHPQLVQQFMAILQDYIEKGRSTAGPQQTNQPDNPTKKWESINWLSNYPKYIATLSTK